MNLLTIKQAMEFLNVTQTWLRTRIFKKEIPYVKVGRLVRFRQVDLEEYVQSNLK